MNQQDISQKQIAETLGRSRCDVQGLQDHHRGNGDVSYPALCGPVNQLPIHDILNEIPTKSLLHARLLHDCDVTHISSIGRVAISISLREHANECSAECSELIGCSKYLITRRLCVLANTKLHHRNLLLRISMKF